MYRNGFFSYAHFTGVIWRSLPRDWRLERPLAPGRQFDMVHESLQKMQPKFIVGDFTSGSLCVRHITFRMMHLCCTAVLACSMHVSRQILADFLEAAIDSWLQ